MLSVPVILEVPPALGSHGPALTRRVGDAVQELLPVLGLPGQAATSLEVNESARVPFQLRVHGRLCRWPDDAVPLWSAAFQGRLPSSEETVNATQEWLQSLTPESAGEFVAFAVIELLKLQPAVLVSEEMLSTYRAELVPLWAEVPAGEKLNPWLIQAVEHRLSLADKSRVAGALRNAAQSKADRAGIGEALLAELSADAVEIRMAPDLLRTLTDTEATQVTDFSLVREGLFYELGLDFPRLQFVADPKLKPGSFAFGINALTTAPHRCLEPTQLLANEAPDRLQLFGITATTSLQHPMTHRLAAVVEASEAAVATDIGVTTWSALGYLALWLSVELRRHAAILLRRETVAQALKLLSRTHPALAELAAERFTTTCICQVLRELLAEEVCVRGLPQILEAMMGCDYVLADEATLILFDERLGLDDEPRGEWPDAPATLAASVRRALRRPLSHQYTRGQSSLPVYLLAPDLESRLAAHGRGDSPLTETEISRLLATVEDEIPPPRGSDSRVILTTTAARRPMRQILAVTRPWLPVVAYQELSPELNLQPLARISLPD
jgi:type III secretion protein V